jgi:hypothetical protein
MHFFLEKIVFFCVSCLEGGEASAKHRAEGEPGRERPRRGNAQISDNQSFNTNILQFNRF